MLGDFFDNSISRLWHSEDVIEVIFESEFFLVFFWSEVKKIVKLILSFGVTKLLQSVRTLSLFLKYSN